MLLRAIAYFCEQMYLFRIPDFLKRLVPHGRWAMPLNGKSAIYLTFDDGPHPIATPFVLDELKKYDAKATFFCLGKNVIEYPQIYERILAEGHRVGNHTHNHLNGWKSPTGAYVENVLCAEKYICTTLFRPPYGRIKRAQADQLYQQGFELIYWSLLSGDFDEKLSPARCLEKTVLRLKPGDIVVFHDSQKAWERLKYVLPRVLALAKKRGWNMETL